MLATALRNLWTRKIRLLTTALSVTLGVAFVTGTLVLTGTMQRTFDNLFTDVYRGTDVVVRAHTAFEGPQGTGQQRGRVPATLVSRVGAVDGVAAAEGAVYGYARIVDKNGTALGNPQNGAPALGSNWSQNPRLNQFQLVSGTAPTSDGDVVIDRKSARDGHFSVGDVATVLTQGGPQHVRIVGIARYGTADSPGGATIVAFPTAQAQRLMGEPGQFDEIAIVARPGVSQRELARRVGAVLPAGDEAVTGKAVTAEAQSAIRKALSFFYTFLLVFAAVSVLVGSFMVFNTFSITVAQRTRETGLLRALGASRRQVLGSVLVEASAVGIAASVVGFGLGLLVAVALRGLIGALGFAVPAEGLVINAGTVAVSLSVGIGVTLAAAFSPARKAAKIPPIAALQSGAVGSAGYGSHERIYVGGGVLALGVLALLAGLFAAPPHSFAIVAAGAVLVFFGVSALGRTVALPLSRGLGLPLRLHGITGELARENAMRNPKRTASSASALMIGVALVGYITIFIASATASVNAAIDRGFTGDIVLDTGGGFAGGVDAGLAREVAGLPQVRTAVGLRVGIAQVDGTATTVQAGDPATLLSVMNVDVRQGRPAALDAGAIGVYRAVAADKHWHIGSPVRVRFAATGARVLRVGLIYGDNAQAGNYFLGSAAYDANFTNRLDNKVFVAVRPGVSTSAALTAVKDVARNYPGVSVLDRGQYKAEQQKILQQLLALVYALLGLAIVIALLGIANTLTLAVTERVHEIGLLRAVGMTRPQVRSMIRWESVLISLQGTALGLAVGIFFGWALTTASRNQGVTVFRVPGTSLVVIAVLAGLAGALAAVLPGRRAARVDVLRAIAAE